VADEDGSLYRGEEGKKTKRRIETDYEREFEKAGMSPEAAKERADRVYGGSVNRVAHEQAAKNPSGVKEERVKGHIAFSDRGARFKVSPHNAEVRSHPHSHGRGHHRGPCDGSCRRGRRAHSHSGRQRAS
jgi:hypothetical protein